MSVRVHVRVLGPLEVEVEGRAVDLPEQLRGVLVALALARRPIAKAELARSVLFVAPRTVDTRLSRLRRALELDHPLHRVTAARSGLIELDRTVVAVDTEEFLRVTESFLEVGRHDAAVRVDALDTADRLWRGAPHTPAPERPDDDPLACSVHELLQRRSQVCALAADMMAKGVLPSDTGRLERWCLEQPDNAAVWFARVVDAVDRGDAATATQLLESWAEAGAVDAARFARATRVVRAGPRSAGRPTSRRRASTAVEADHPVIDALERWLDTVRARTVSSRMLVGHPGPALTRMVDAVVRYATELGFHPLCVDATTRSGTPAMLRTLFEPLMRDALRDPTTPEAIDAIFDELHQLFEAQSQDSMAWGDREPVDAIRQVGASLVALLRALPEARPLLIVVENRDLAPRELDAVLEVLVQSEVREIGILSVSRDLGPEWRAGLEPWSLLVADRPAPTHDVDVPIERADADAAFLTRNAAARRALAVCALCTVDDVCDLDLARALDEGIDPAVGTELANGSILRTIDDVTSFVDPTMTRAAADFLDPLERRRLNARAIDVIDGRLQRSSDPEQVAALAIRLARHAGEAGNDARPRARAVRALTLAAGLVGPLESDRAAALYGRALELTTDSTERLGLLMERAKLRWSSAEWNAAEDDLARVVAQTDAVDDLTLTTEALLLTAQLTWDPSRAGGSLRDRLLVVLDGLPPSEAVLRARVRACLAGGLYQDGATGDDALDAAALARDALATIDELLVPVDPVLEAEVVWWARKGLLDIVDPTATAALSRRLLATAGDSPHLRGNALLATIVDELVLGRVAVARKRSAEFARLADQTGSPMQQYMVATLHGLWALHDGRYAEVATETAAAERLGAPFGGVTVTQVVEGQRILAGRDQGRFRDDPGLVDVVEAFVPVDGPIPIWATATAWLRADVGDFAVALGRLDDITARTADFTHVPRGPHRLPFLAFAAETLERLHSFDHPCPRIATLARHVRCAIDAHPASGVLLGWPVAYLGPKEHFAGLAAAAAGDDEQAMTLLRAAGRRTDPTTPLHLRGQLAIAAATARRGDVASARRATTRLAHHAENMGLPGLVADASRILDRP